MDTDLLTSATLTTETKPPQGSENIQARKQEQGYVFREETIPGGVAALETFANVMKENERLLARANKLEGQIKVFKQELRRYTVGRQAMKLSFVAMCFSAFALVVYAFGGVEIVNPIFSAGLWITGTAFLYLGHLFDKEEMHIWDI